MKIKFNNMIHGDVPVALDLRQGYSDLLVNRDLMRRMSVAVNPNRTFVLSKKVDYAKKNLD